MTETPAPDAAVQIAANVIGDGVPACVAREVIAALARAGLLHVAHPRVFTPGDTVPAGMWVIDKHEEDPPFRFNKDTTIADVGDTLVEVHVPNFAAVTSGATMTSDEIARDPEYIAHQGHHGQGRDDCGYCPSVADVTAAETVGDSGWIRKEVERARDRIGETPRYARPVVTRPVFAARAEAAGTAAEGESGNLADEECCATCGSGDPRVPGHYLGETCGDPYHAMTWGDESGPPP